MVLNATFKGNRVRVMVLNATFKGNQVGMLLHIYSPLQSLHIHVISVY